MNRPLRRRTFLRSVATAGLASPAVMPSLVRAASPNQTLHHASFGANGMAWGDIRRLTGHKHVKLVAACDVDERRFGKVAKNFPDAARYVDWRKLLDKERKRIDTCNVSVPDHMHGPIGYSALDAGLHVYGQKPLCHEIAECRALGEKARRTGLVTQMGIQVHSNTRYQLAARLVRDGAIGKVREVHTWSGKKWGSQKTRPDRSDTPPDPFHWNLWLGVAEQRPFIGKEYYHPRNWRKRLDFGTGTFGDMGCHIYDPVYHALNLTAPLSLRSRGPKPNETNWATNAHIEYVFPGTEYTAGETVPVTWYDGDNRPPESVQQKLEDLKMPYQGSIFIGTEGVMLLPHVSTPRLRPKEKFADFEYPDVEPGNHYHQFVEACLGNGATSTPFDEYAGPLTESVLLGGAATHFPDQQLKWDAKNLRFTNHEPANAKLSREYRSGWKIDGLG